MNRLLIAGGVFLLACGAGAAQAGPQVAGAKGFGGGRGVTTIPSGGLVGRPIRHGNHHFGNRFGVGTFEDRWAGRHGHRRGHRRDWPGYFPVWGYYGDGDGYVETEMTPDMFGYFATGGEVELVDGQAMYDYDRSYPYDWYRGDRTEPAGVQIAYPAAPRCETSWVPDASGRERVPVRVCRR
jgi:hypothetical protein